MTDRELVKVNRAPSVEAQPAAAESPVIAGAMVECWRCGKQVEAELPRCRFCKAALFPKPSADRQDPASGEEDARILIRMLIVYGCMLVTSIILGLLHRDAGFISTNRIPPSQEQVLTEIFIFEGLDTILIFSAWALMLHWHT